MIVIKKTSADVFRGTNYVYNIHKIICFMLCTITINTPQAFYLNR